ncbi:MAG: RdgB/HAM1 family non-canonical purine NTP pyrophosphatase [Spirochaetaceae bacterium]|jgi:XTP/dITP diphosphohydrolase|nr:RdgB/HAM1 family non-canonical purine NTP pyrophosphatase [Spirochaetaceae bacterium]
MEIWFATGNAHKRRELEDILQTALSSPQGVVQEAVTLKIPCEADIPFDPEENGATFFENALIKAQALYEITGKPVIADDSGLCVEALGGLPGIFSARYRGRDADYSRADVEKHTDGRRNSLLLHELEGEHNRRACFVCCMVLYTGTNSFYAAQQTLEGLIVKAGRGEGGFGYDPLLYLPELGKTVAELDEAEKNRLSHRGKAGRAIAGFLPALADCRRVVSAAGGAL